MEEGTERRRRLTLLLLLLPMSLFV